MGVVLRGLSDRAVNWALAVAAALVVLGILALAAVYIRDNYLSSSPSILERETQLAEEALRENPSDVASLLRLGSIYLERGWEDQAIPLFEQALALEADEPSALVSLGVAYQREGDDDKAVEYFEQVVGLLSESEYAAFDERLFLAFYNLGRIHSDHGRWEEAIAALESAAALRSANADVLLALGIAYQAQDRQEDALQQLQRAFHLVPDFKEVYEALRPSYEAVQDQAGLAFARGMILFLDGKTDQAREKLEEALATQEDGDIYWALGWVSEEEGLWKEAMEDYQQAMRLDPTHYPAAAGIGRLQARQGAGSEGP